MAKYLVKTPLAHNGEKYAPGDTVELTKKQADAMPWCVEPKKKAPEKKQPEKKEPEKKPESTGDGGDKPN